MIQTLRRLATNRRGGTAIEYGLIVSLVVIAMITALKGVASTTSGMWADVSSAVIAASTH
jgi:pilus assembly protein Flp/PilA